MIFKLDCFYSKSANRRKQNDWFYGNICIKEYLEIEETQVVCFGHPKNIYFMMNSSNIFHCGMYLIARGL